MKFIKITLSNGAPCTLSMEQAEAIFKSKNQIVMITDANGNWTGRVINKAYIVSADRDKEEEKTYRIANPMPALPEPEHVITPEEAASIEEKKRQIREKFGAKPYPDA